MWEEYYPAADPASAWQAGRITPVYGLTEGLTNKQMRQYMHEALTAAEKRKVSRIYCLRPWPKSASFWVSAQALHAVHFPSSLAELENARARLAYEEFLLLATALGRQAHPKEHFRQKITPIKSKNIC